MDQSEVLTVSEAAQRLRISKRKGLRALTRRDTGV